MRVKIGDTWYVVQPGVPICIELEASDKENIANMTPAATKYASFHEVDTTTDEHKLAWMKDEVMY